MKKKHKISRALFPKEPQYSSHLNVEIICPEVPSAAPGGGCPYTPHMEDYINSSEP